MKRAALFLTVALLLVTGFLGVSNGSSEIGDAQTGLQRSVSMAVMLYGFLGFIAGFGILRRETWSVAVAIGWSVAVLYAGTVASFAYSDPTFSQEGTLAGVIGAFVAIVLIAAFVVWTARSATRVPRPAERAHIPPS